MTEEKIEEKQEIVKVKSDLKKVRKHIENLRGTFRIKDGKIYLMTANGSIQRPFEEIREQLGFHKKTTIYACFVREAIDKNTLKTLKAVFMQEFEVEINEKYPFVYLYVNAPSSYYQGDIEVLVEGALAIRHFDLSMAYTIDCLSEVEGDVLTIAKIGEPKKLNAKEFRALRKKHGYVGLFSDELFSQKTVYEKRV